jgi:multidrug efflux pump subunit AcrB
LTLILIPVLYEWGREAEKGMGAESSDGGSRDRAVKIFIERPVATAMFFLALLVLGVYSYLNTPIELLPTETFPRLDIQAAWGNVPPEIIQTQITAPIEEAIAAVKGVRKMTSYPASGPAW